MADKRELEEAFRFFLNGELERMIFSNPRNRDHYIKMTVRPLMLKGTLKFQVEEFTEKQAFQKNMDREEALSYLLKQLDSLYRNGEVVSGTGSMNVLVGKKGTVTVKKKLKIAPGQKGKGAASGNNLSVEAMERLASHNRKKITFWRKALRFPFWRSLA